MCNTVIKGMLYERYRHIQTLFYDCVDLVIVHESNNLKNTAIKGMLYDRYRHIDTFLYECVDLQ